MGRRKQVPGMTTDYNSVFDYRFLRQTAPKTQRSPKLSSFQIVTYMAQNSMSYLSNLT